MPAQLAVVFGLPTGRGVVVVFVLGEWAEEEATVDKREGEQKRKKKEGGHDEGEHDDVC